MTTEGHFFYNATTFAGLAVPFYFLARHRHSSPINEDLQACY
jgi:hypothetical protein